MAKTIKDIAKKMRGIDITMFETKAQNGELASRPMSNNGDVDYDGDSYFFTCDDKTIVKEIERDPAVTLSFSGKPGLLGLVGKPASFYASARGKAELIRDKAAFKKHWTPGLNFWFDKGIDTPGLMMIKVHAASIHYWDGMEQGTVRV